MARYTGPVCRLCRREGEKLYLKGERCFTGKCAVDRRTYAPGQHGQGRKKVSEYGIQLREKQKAKRIYGILEKQFRSYFEEADRQKGITGENLLRLLERRLDNVVFRMGIGGARPEARQIVRHGHIEVNGRRVDIPSYQVRVGDVITVKEGSKDSVRIKELLESGAAKTPPAWLDRNLEDFSAKVVALPAREDLDLNIQEHLIVELYSR